jgi:hypothetical protein
MDEDQLPVLRQRVAALTQRESDLLEQAFALAKSGGERKAVDSLFAESQSVQIERHGVKKRIAQLLGTRRLHLAREVWQPGTYDYLPGDRETPMRATVTAEPLGLYVMLPGAARAVRIESLGGTFDGPVGTE